MQLGKNKPHVLSTTQHSRSTWYSMGVWHFTCSQVSFPWTDNPLCLYNMKYEIKWVFKPKQPAKRSTASRMGLLQLIVLFVLIERDQYNPGVQIFSAKRECVCNSYCAHWQKKIQCHSSRRFFCSGQMHDQDIILFYILRPAASENYRQNINVKMPI